MFVYISLSAPQIFKVNHRKYYSLAQRLHRIVERGGLWDQAGFEPVSSKLCGSCCGRRAVHGHFSAALGKPGSYSTDFLPENWRLDLGGGRAGIWLGRAGGVAVTALNLCISAIIASSPPKMPFPCPLARPEVEARHCARLNWLVLKVTRTNSPFNFS